MVSQQIDTYEIYSALLPIFMTKTRTSNSKLCAKRGAGSSKDSRMNRTDLATIVLLYNCWEDPLQYTCLLYTERDKLAVGRNCEDVTKEKETNPDDSSLARER